MTDAFFICHVLNISACTFSAAIKMPDYALAVQCLKRSSFATEHFQVCPGVVAHTETSQLQQGMGCPSTCISLFALKCVSFFFYFSSFHTPTFCYFYFYSSFYFIFCVLYILRIIILTFANLATLLFHFHSCLLFPLLVTLEFNFHSSVSHALKTQPFPIFLTFCH